MSDRPNVHRGDCDENPRIWDYCDCAPARVREYEAQVAKLQAHLSTTQDEAERLADRLHDRMIALEDLAAEIVRLQVDRDEAVTLYNIGAALASDDENETALVLAHREIDRLTKNLASAEAGYFRLDEENERLKDNERQASMERDSYFARLSAAEEKLAQVTILGLEDARRAARAEAVVKAAKKVRGPGNDFADLYLAIRQYEEEDR